MIVAVLVVMAIFLVKVCAVIMADGGVGMVLTRRGVVSSEATPFAF